jgi:hypothetical protein
MLFSLVYHNYFWKYVISSLRDHRAAAHVLNADDVEQKSTGRDRIWELEFSCAAILRQLGELV